MSPSARVLIVDDREIARLTIRNVLFGYDCTFWEAPDGATALGLIASTHFDVVFLDLILPDMRGEEVLVKVHHQRMPVGPVIVISGASDQAMTIFRQIAAFDIFRFLEKPMDRDCIRSAFVAALESRHHRGDFCASTRVTG